MHLYVAVKGTLTSIDQWEKDLQAVKVPFEYEKDTKCLWRVAVRPVRLYEIGFPEDQLQTVLSCIGIGLKGNYILDRYPMLKRWAGRIRKILKLQKVPNPEKIIDHMQPNQIDKAVAVIPIGIKKDKFGSNEHPDREHL